jgi:hypothetical protein
MRGASPFKLGRVALLDLRGGRLAALAPGIMTNSRFKPGDRVVIAHGPGAGVAGVVVAISQNEPPGEEYVSVIFDREPGMRYRAQIAGLDRETLPKKAQRPNIQRHVRANRR